MDVVYIYLLLLLLMAARCSMQGTYILTISNNYTILPLVLYYI